MMSTFAGDKPESSGSFGFADDASSKNRLYFSIVALAFAFLYYISYIRYGIVQTDEGAAFDNIERMMRGERWNEDFVVMFGPLRFWVLSKIFSFVGESFFVFRLYFIVFRLVGLALTIAVARRLMPALPAAAALFMAIVMPGLIFKSDMLVAPMLLVWLSIGLWESPGKAWPFLLGLAAGFSMWFRLEMIVPASLFSAGAIEYFHIATPSNLRDRMIRRLSNYAGIAVGVVSLAVAFPGLANVVRIFVYAAGNNLEFHGHVPWPSISDLSSNPDKLASFFVFWGVIVIYAASTLEMAVRFRSEHKTPAYAYRLLVLAMGGMIGYNYVYQGSIGHVLPGATPAYILLADGFYRLFGMRNRAVKIAAIAVFGAIFAAFSSYALYFSRMMPAGTISMRWYMDKPVDSDLGRVYFHSPRSEWINDTVKYIRENTSANDEVATMHEPFMITVLARRKNPLVFTPLSPRLLQYVGGDFVEKHYRSLDRAAIVVYYVNPSRVVGARSEAMILSNFDPQMREIMLRNFTFAKLIGDYVILKKGVDSSIVTRSFVEGWEAYRYGDYVNAEKSLNAAVEAGLPASEIADLLEKVKDRGV